MDSRSAKRKKKRSGLKIALIVIGVIVLIAAGGIYYVYGSVKSTANKMHEGSAWNGSDKRKNALTPDKGDPLSILILGVDERQGDRGRSDTLILVTVNPKTNKMVMTSIPRDTRTEIVGKGTEDKINHAYAFGGEKMAIKTVENFLDVPVDYYVKVNMESFQGLVDALGGVTVDNERLAFKYDGYTFPKGELKLSGKEALAYTRMRKEDPQGDFGRNARQRQVISAIINEGAQVSSVTKMGDILDVIGSNVKTNLTFDEMKDIQSKYKGARNNVDNVEIKGNGQMINGIYYLIIPDEERTRIQTMLKEQLEIS
ncbi:transcriptional attenuator, LytR family [Fictibacillus solisalsi]|uniref:Polyisoprenyl-teichoic acid--peptidoglycan teichoic acid transferase TagU n=1 Tax=Fictibacillus solisalsi TaxID=459525 RepID=A0A1G9YPD4_9BACL|nr:LytR family transcriptional regulator [Fictibacillus solisalsi]SDN10475.1 transcriptional attenuator, LytR family [Fictibacillus solisalsi]